MKLGKEYKDLATVLRFDPKEESVAFSKCDEGIAVAEGSICIKGDFGFDDLGQTASVFGLTEDNSALIETMDKLEESNFGILFKGSPRIVHKSELNVGTLEEKIDVKDVYSTQARLGAGYTDGGEVIIAALESATVKQLGQLMQELGCTEAINVYGKVGTIEYKSIQSEPQEEAVQEKKPTAPRKRRNKKQA